MIREDKFYVSICFFVFILWLLIVDNKICQFEAV